MMILSKQKTRSSPSASTRAHVKRYAAGSLAVALLAACFGTAQASTTITRTSAFDYGVSTGLLLKEVIEPFNSDKCLVTSYVLDAYGHRTSSTTRNCAGASSVTPGAPPEAGSPAAPAVFQERTTSETYTLDQQYVERTTNALGHSETKTYDYRFGSVATLTGPNQLTTSWAYDAFGRKIAEKRADGTGNRWEYKYCAGFGGTESCPTIAGAKGVHTVTSTPLKGPFDINAATAAAPNGPYVKVYYDTLGREIRSETEGYDGRGASALIFRDTEYDNKGRAIKKSRPYFSGAAAVHWISYEYDDLNRLTATTEPTGAGTATVTVAYNGLETTTTDALLRRKIETRDVAGQVVNTVDHTGATLNRLYDAFGNLVRSVDAKGNVTSLVYDVRGRKTALYDPDMGVWSYAYNAVGELVQQTDAKGQTSSLTYDRGGRLLQRTEPGLTSNWFYDDRYADGSPCTKAVGKLCEAKTDNGYASRTIYDALSRPSNTVTSVGGSYTASVVYEANTGRVISQTYPSGLQIQNTYTPRLGFLRSVVDARTGAALWTAGSYDAEGHPLQYTHGNGVLTTNDYYPDGRLNTTRAGPSGSVQTLSHAYDLAGNLKTRSDLLTGVSASYGYDELNRLTSETRSGGSVSPAQVMGWAYDSIGNMTSRTEGGSVNVYNYPSSGAGSARPHAVASVSGFVSGYGVPVYSYDANGNLTSGGGRTVTWNSFDKVQSIARSNAKLDYLYDAGHQRVQELYYLHGAVQRRTVYLNPAAGAGLYYEEETGAAGTKIKHYVSANGATVAMISCTALPCTSTANTTTQYWHLDHLHSVSTITDAGGNVVERLAYEPFGKRRHANGVADANGNLVAVSTDRGYTGHEHMDEVGLINMNGRVFDPGLGRFLSADPYIQNPDSLQSYNRYSYGWNSPLNGSDPTGYSWASKTWQKAWHNETFQAIVTLVIADSAGPGWAIAYTGARTYYETGSPGQGLKAAALTWITIDGNFAIGSFVTDLALNTLAHAAWGCAMSSAGGGSCRSGAISGGAGAALSNYGGEMMKGWSKPVRIAAHAVVGGTASVLGGGKFANGALTSGFAYLYNCLAHGCDMKSEGYEATYYSRDGIRCNGGGNGSCADPHGSAPSDAGWKRGRATKASVRGGPFAVDYNLTTDSVSFVGWSQRPGANLKVTESVYFGYYESGWAPQIKFSWQGGFLVGGDGSIAVGLNGFKVTLGVGGGYFGRTSGNFPMQTIEPGIPALPNIAAGLGEF